MRAAAIVLLAALCAAPGLAMAQVPSVTVPGRGQQAQQMPAQTQTPQLQPGQYLPATPPAPGSAPPPAGPATPGIAPVAPVQADWVAQGTAELRAIDKVMARTTTLTLKVGETVRFGPLSVLVRSCVVRPADRAPDAAAFLEVGEPARPPFFRGWMVLSLPQLALVEHPTHDIRLAACRP